MYLLHGQILFDRSIGIVLVFDICIRNSFENLPKWMQEIKQKGKQSALTILVGNKCDQAEKRQVSTQEAYQFAEDNGFNYIEVSAKTGENVDSIFCSLAKEIISRINQNLIDFSSESSGIKIGTRKSSPAVLYKEKLLKDKENNKKNKDIEKINYKVIADQQEEANDQSQCSC